MHEDLETGRCQTTSMAAFDTGCHRSYVAIMKAVSINISLNPELAEFARADSAARAFGSMSEYMRDLIRKRRQEQIELDVAYLEKAMEGAPLGDPSDEEMADIVKTQHRLRAERKRESRS
jgi:Arc/MetJ-type ribon-helix-helix transcriptional regulator